MTNLTKRAIATCVGTVAFACAVVQPARAADIPGSQYYGGPVEEGYVDQPPPPAYRYVPAQPRVYYEPAPPPVVVMPEPYYYAPPRRVYVHPGYGAPGYGPYGARGYGPYVARGYGYHRGWHGGPRHW
jgi:hypothetical protein